MYIHQLLNGLLSKSVLTFLSLQVSGSFWREWILPLYMPFSVLMQPSKKRRENLSAVQWTRCTVNAIFTAFHLRSSDLYKSSSHERQHNEKVMPTAYSLLCHFFVTLEEEFISRSLTFPNHNRKRVSLMQSRELLKSEWDGTRWEFFTNSKQEGFPNSVIFEIKKCWESIILWRIAVNTSTYTNSSCSTVSMQILNQIQELLSPISYRKNLDLATIQRKTFKRGHYNNEWLPEIYSTLSDSSILKWIHEYHVIFK